MAHLYVYSPSGAVRDRASFRRGIRRLKAMGHEVEIDPDALTSWQRFAGDDATRLAAMGRAAASGADLALTTRGGYGITRVLDRLPLRAITRAIERGTQFVGYSDFTALQMALLGNGGAVTWGGPALCEGFGAADAADQAQGHGGQAHAGVDEVMLACFDDLLTGAGEGTGWRLPLPRKTQAAPARALPAQWQTGPATLWGGNLAVLLSLLGTPYFPDVKGGVLFLEDVAEHPYRVERMLTQLLHAGVLARQKAILLGQFTEYQLGPHDRGFNLDQVVAWLRTQVKVPILTGLPFGHVPTKVLLPVGRPVHLLVEGREALVLWGHAHG